MLYPFNHGKAFICSTKRLGGLRCQHPENGRIRHLQAGPITDAVLGHSSRPHHELAVNTMLLQAYEERLAEIDTLLREPQDIQAALDRVNTELSRLIALVASGAGDVAEVAAAIKAKKVEQASLLQRSEDPRWAERAVARWTKAEELSAPLHRTRRETLEQGPEGRRILRQMITQPITVTQVFGVGREFQGWHFEGVAKPGLVLSGLAPSYGQNPWAARG